MRSFKTEGIVIKRRNFSEADRIITIFSKRNGKITIKASGVRRITSRRSSHTELLNHSIFSLYQAKNMPLLTEIDSLNNFSDLKKDLKKVAASYHICELIDGLCAENSLPAGRQEENEAIFNLLTNTLNKIANNFNLKEAVYEFEIELLNLLGFHKKEQSKIRVNTQQLIEGILERKLKTRQILLQFTS